MARFLFLPVAQPDSFAPAFSVLRSCGCIVSLSILSRITNSLALDQLIKDLEANYYYNIYQKPSSPLHSSLLNCFVIYTIMTKPEHLQLNTLMKNGLDEQEALYSCKLYKVLLSVSRAAWVYDYAAAEKVGYTMEIASGLSCSKNAVHASHL